MSNFKKLTGLKQTKLNARSWAKLPPYVQRDLKNSKFENWYKHRNNNVVKRLTLLNAYLKLKKNNLWEFVQKPASEDPNDIKAGALEFLTKKPNDLIRHLKKSRDFTSPGSGPVWNSRENVEKFSLHFKHFKGWKKGKIEVHVDPTGFGGPFTWLPHLMEWLGDEYKHVAYINQGLRSKGYDFDQFKPKKTGIGRGPIHKFSTELGIVRPYEIKKGDRIWNLYKRFGYNNPKNFTRDALKANPGLDPRGLRIGQKIFLPFMMKSAGGMKKTLATKKPSYSDRFGPIAIKSYKVKHKDTLWKLAPKFGYQNPRSFVKDFQGLNPEINPNRIYTGSSYKFPFKTGSSSTKFSGSFIKPTFLDSFGAQSSSNYLVKRGDTLWKLAPKFGYQNPRSFVKDFQKINLGVNPNLIYYGRNYRMPHAVL